MPPTRRPPRRQRLAGLLVDFVTSPKMRPALQQLLRAPAGRMVRLEVLVREALGGDPRFDDLIELWVGWLRFAPPDAVGQGQVFITAYDAKTWWTWHAVHNRALALEPERVGLQEFPARTKQHAR